MVEIGNKRVRPELVYPVLNMEEVNYIPPPGLLIESIPQEKLVDKLGLKSMPGRLQESVKSSTWQTVAGGRIYLEVRNPLKLTAPRLTDTHAIDTHVLDFDDCVFNASGWHEREYQIAGRFGIDPKIAKDIYEYSKLNIPKVAEQEPRYTPEANLILLSRYAGMLKQGKSLEEAGKGMLMWRDMMVKAILEVGEVPALSGFSIDPEILQAFVENSPFSYVHDEFVEDVIGGTAKGDIRMIATRGKPEGPLGQINKVHESGVLESYGREDNIIDLVIYTNDIKAEALLDVLRLMPRLGETAIRVYDDNPKEVLPYIESARRLGVKNLEVIQVEHPTAKRRGMKVGIDPDFTQINDQPGGEPRTNFNHYFASPQQAYIY